MHKFISFLFLVFLGLFSNWTRAEDAIDAYRLRHGDSISVAVWREESLQKEVLVLPDGSITFPLAGRIDVAGLSSAEVEKRLAEKLKAFIPDPVVSVMITGIDGSRIFILGKVSKPGPVVLSAPTTALQALSQAGGLEKFADADAIRIVRGAGKDQQVIPLKYNQLIKGNDLSTDIELKAGDMILVP
jgi:polysaccharide export outer membrane protein